MRPMKVGIDFDNTLVSYDNVFLKAASEHNLLPQSFSGGKKDVRNAIRASAGEAAWTKLQAEVYGNRMAEARMIEGAKEFVAACRESGATVNVVSHKTRFAAADPGGADLHAVARSWMEANGFFSKEGLGLRREDIYFEPTREGKCRRIEALGCGYFIDDLEEVFREPSFPLGVQCFLLHRGDGPVPSGPFTAFASWDAITEAVFSRAG
jgi:hypothetical protein